NLIALDSLSDFSAASRWMARKYLYNKLESDTTLISTDTLSSFISANNTTSVGHFYNIKRKISQFNSLDSALNSEMQSHREEVNEYTTEIALNNGRILLLDSTSQPIIDSLNDANASINDTIRTLVAFDDSV